MKKVMTQAERNAVNEQKGVLTREQVLLIKQGLAKGQPRRLLAELFGVGIETISRIDRGDTWGWLKTDEDLYNRITVVTEKDEQESAESLGKLMKMMEEKKKAEAVGDRLVEELETEIPQGKNRFGL